MILLSIILLLCIRIRYCFEVDGVSLDLSSTSDVQFYSAFITEGYWKAIGSDATGKYLVGWLYQTYPQMFTVMVSHDFGASWFSTAVNASVFSDCDAFASADSTGQYWVVGSSASLSAMYVSVDYGQTWSQWGPALFHVTYFSSVATTSTGQYLIGSGPAGTYQSSTYGYTWNEVTTDKLIWVISSGDGSFRAGIACDKSNSRKIRFYSNWNFTSAFYYKIIDLESSCKVPSLAADSTGQTLFISNSYQMFRSIDFGIKWTDVSDSIIDSNNNEIVVSWEYIACDGNCKVIVGTGFTSNYTENSVLISYNSGLNWKYGIITEYPYLVTIYPIVSKDGSFIALAASPVDVPSPFEASTKSGKIFVSSNPFLLEQGFIEPNTTTTDNSIVSTYTFRNLGYITSDLYLTALLELAYFDSSSTDSEFIISTGNNGNQFDNQILFVGKCAPQYSCLDPDAFYESEIPCIVNIPLNNSYVSANGQANSSFEVIVTLSEPKRVIATAVKEHNMNIKSGSFPPYPPCAAYTDSSQSVYFSMMLQLTTYPLQQYGVDDDGNANDAQAEQLVLWLLVLIPSSVMAIAVALYVTYYYRYQPQKPINSRDSNLSNSSKNVSIGSSNTNNDANIITAQQKKINYYLNNDSIADTNINPQEFSRNRRNLLDSLAYFWNFFSFGVQFSIEIWLIIVIQSNSDLHSMKLFSFAMVLLRCLNAVPTCLLLLRVFRSERDEYLSKIDLKMLARNKIIASFGLLCLLLNSELFKYLPWIPSAVSESQTDSYAEQKQTEIISETEGKSKLLEKQSTEEEQQQKKLNPTITKENEFFGYPDKKLLDLCSSIRLLYALISLIVQSYYINHQQTKALHNSNLLIIELVYIYFSLSCVRFAQIVVLMLAIQLKYANLLSYFETSKFFGIFEKVLFYVKNELQMKRKMKEFFIVKQKFPLIAISYLLKILLVSFGVNMISQWKCYELPFSSSASQQSQTKVYFFLEFPLFVLIGYIIGFVILLVEFFVYFERDFDAHLELISISASYSLDSQKITQLLQFSMVFFATIEIFGCVSCFYLYYEISSIYGNTMLNRCDIKELQEHIVENLFVTVGIIELFVPLLLFGLSEYRAKTQNDSHSDSNTNSSNSKDWLGTMKMIGKALCRVDVLLICWFLKLMLSWVFPLSVLSNVSIIKASIVNSNSNNNGSDDNSKTENNNNSTSNLLLSFQLRDNWDEIDNANTYRTNAVKSNQFLPPRGSMSTSSTMAMSAAEQLPTPIASPIHQQQQQQQQQQPLPQDQGQREHKGSEVRYDSASATSKSVIPYLPVSLQQLVERLSKRFTVVYSFAKLCGTIAFTLIANDAYRHCSKAGQYHNVQSCSVTYYWDNVYEELQYSNSCNSYCFSEAFPTKFIYPVETVADCPPLPPTQWICDIHVSSECLCSNWLVFQFIIIVLHIIHYFVQCYFYIRYNYFDPQQNQINCVETYTFAGDNLALFLTHPSICFLSILEAICIVIVWVDVVIPPMHYCDSNYSINAEKLPFAIFITFIEVYKANLSTCIKLAREHAYWWALWSLIRIDLFVFYGFTLFMQTFFFPFSVIGYSVSGYRKLKTVDGDGNPDSVDEHEGTETDTVQAEAVASVINQTDESENMGDAGNTLLHKLLDR